VVAAGAEDAGVLAVPTGVLEVEEGDDDEHAPTTAVIVSTAIAPAAIRTP
jgi:hypothetical protein